MAGPKRALTRAGGPTVRRSVAAGLAAAWAIGCGGEPASEGRAVNAAPGVAEAALVPGSGPAGACDAGTYDPPARDGAPADAFSLRLNIPAFRLTASAEDAPVVSLPVSVGAPEFPTPVGDFLITDVTWNPWWDPPDSEWAKGRRPEPPGPANPMGSVKIRFGPLLFLHGTPDTASIGTPSSHGCVRLRDRDALLLSGWLLAAGTPDSTAGLPQVYGETRTVRLVRPVRFAIAYETAELADGDLVLHPDPYGRAPDPVGTALGVLEAAGIPATERVRARLPAASPAPGAPPVRIPLDSLRREP